MSPLVDKAQLLDIQKQVHQVKASPALLDYVQRLVAFTRSDSQFSYGLSPRGALALVGAAKAWALIHQRDYLVPEDVQTVMPAVVGHRVRGIGHNNQGDPLVQRLRDSVDVLG
jgi:MoxR-like ATPase